MGFQKIGANQFFYAKKTNATPGTIFDENNLESSSTIQESMKVAVCLESCLKLGFAKNTFRTREERER